mmetsp:Transcript_42525/g.77648  ORF Transcript_42525/g.77648 Transcript_42525/m.77648 type:complete len:200 (-) Transcript_42525:225-824(-)
MPTAVRRSTSPCCATSRIPCPAPATARSPRALAASARRLWISFASSCTAVHLKIRVLSAVGSCSVFYGSSTHCLPRRASVRSSGARIGQARHPIRPVQSQRSPVHLPRYWKRHPQHPNPKNPYHMAILLSCCRPSVSWCEQVDRQSGCCRIFWRHLQRTWARAWKVMGTARAASPPWEPAQAQTDLASTAYSMRRTSQR